MQRSDAITVIARTVHEAVRAYQAALEEPEAPVWAESDWMQESSREAVEFALNEPTPGAQHDAWVAAKKRDGWSYGPTKDPVKKTHPGLVEFSELSESEKRKDALIIAIVTAAARVLGVGPGHGSPVAS